MDVLKTFLEAMYTSPHYSYGWLVLAGLAILPAIVSGNLVQQALFKLANKTSKPNLSAKPLLLNTAVLLICICIIAYTFYLYIWTQT